MIEELTKKSSIFKTQSSRKTAIQSLIIRGFVINAFQLRITNYLVNRY